METPFHAANRLLLALEELGGEETLLIRTMDFVEAVAVQERAAPLLEKLCSLAGAPGVEALRPRLDALLDRSGQNHHFLDAQLTRIQSELTRVNEARGRLRRVAPAYGQAPALTQSRLNTAA